MRDYQNNVECLFYSIDYLMIMYHIVVYILFYEYIEMYFIKLYEQVCKGRVSGAGKRLSRYAENCGMLVYHWQITDMVYNEGNANI
jgi:hypothetical protein